MDQWTFYFTRHKGTDFRAYFEPLRAPEDGQIVFQKKWKGGGYWIHFKGKSGILHKFAHLSRYYYGLGNHIPVGAIMALTGASGWLCRGAHLHYEMWQNRQQINPETFNFNKLMKVDNQKLHQIYNEILLRIADKDAQGYLGLEEEEARRLIGGSEERKLLIRLVEIARGIKSRDDKDAIYALINLATRIN